MHRLWTVSIMNLNLWEDDLDGEVIRKRKVSNGSRPAGGVKVTTSQWNQVWCCGTTSLPAATDHHPMLAEYSRGYTERGGGNIKKYFRSRRRWCSPKELKFYVTFAVGRT